MIFFAPYYFGLWLQHISPSVTYAKAELIAKWGMGLVMLLLTVIAALAGFGVGVCIAWVLNLIATCVWNTMNDFKDWITN